MQTILDLTLSKLKVQNGFVGKSAISSAENSQKQSGNEGENIGIVTKAPTTSILNSLSVTTPSGFGDDSGDETVKKENYEVRQSHS